MDSTYLTLQWACHEASRCLSCFDAPCVKGCPAKIDIPQFIRRLKWGDIKGAKKTIKKANCLGALCGYLCPSEELCEKNCVRIQMDTSVKIAALQRFVCDQGVYRLEIETDKRTNRRVAVIGAGPAGISCAIALRDFGHEVEIYEKEKFITGTVMKEIPEFKIPQGVIEKEVGELAIDKIRVYWEREVDQKLLEDITKAYDAIFFGIGLNKSKEAKFNLKGLKNVYDASEFLHSVKTKEKKQVKGICVTIGGGDTALDCARTVLSLGAKRSMVAYRRSKNEMPAAEAEFLDSVKKGVEFLWQVSPVRLIGQKKITGVELIRTELVPSKNGGRKKFKEIPGSKFKFPADAVIFSLGKNHDDLSVVILERGKRKIDPDTLQIGDTKYFAGGDFVNQGKTVVEAVAHGKMAAVYIDKFLKSL